MKPCDGHVGTQDSCSNTATEFFDSHDAETGGDVRKHALCKECYGRLFTKKKGKGGMVETLKKMTSLRTALGRIQHL